MLHTTGKEYLTRAKMEKVMETSAMWTKGCTELRFLRAQICAEREIHERKKERGEQGPSRWQETVATETQRGENNEGLEWCFMSHHNTAMRPEPALQQYSCAQ